MKPIEKRLQELEVQQKGKRRLIPVVEQQAAEDAMLESAGITREQMRERFGGFPGLAYALMIGTIGPPIERKPDPDDGLTAQERYFEMIGHKGGLR